MQQSMDHLSRFLQQLRSADYAAIIGALISVNFFDIASFLDINIEMRAEIKIAVAIIAVLGVVFFVGTRRDFKTTHTFEEQSKSEADFFRDWYSKAGKLVVFCTDLEWLENPRYSHVVQALEEKAKSKHLEIYLKRYDNDIVQDLVRRGAVLYRVKKEIVSEHRFSININEHVYSMILRNKKLHPTSITVEEYIDHRALANLGLDMLQDSHHGKMVE